jgi:hypothetical protein
MEFIDRHHFIGEELPELIERVKALSWGGN